MKKIPPVAGPVTLFRFVFGACLFGHIVWSYFPTVIHEYFVAPEFHFKFFLFSWVPVPGPVVLYPMFAFALAAAVALAAGLMVRLSALVAGLCLTWFLLMDSTWFQNHYYFVCLLCALFALVPPKSEAKWILHLFRFQFAVVYIFGGIAKLNADWLSGKPMALALSALAEEPLFPSFLDAKGFALFFAWGGLLFDLLIVPALLYRKTRLAGIVALAGFHITNLSFWGLGAFPWLMLAGTMILFCPDEVRALLRKSPLALTVGATADGPAPAPAAKAWITLWAAFQLLMPMRQYLYEGPTRWHQQGDYFSWTMKLNQYSHFTELEILDPATQEFRKVSFAENLTHDQKQSLHDPDHLLQLVHFIGERESERRNKPVTFVRARTFLSLNGAEFAPLIQAEANLLTSERQFAPHDWVLPYNEDRTTAGDR